MVEFAFALPFLLLLIVGLIEFGMTFNFWLSLNDVASAGARQAAVGKSATEVKDFIRSNLLAGGLRAKVEGPDGYITLCIPSATAKVGVPVTVKVGVDPYPIFNMTSGFRLMDVNLRGSSTMRLEQAPAGTAPSNGWDTPATSSVCA